MAPSFFQKTYLVIYTSRPLSFPPFFFFFFFFGGGGGVSVILGCWAVIFFMAVEVL